jgi:hypothetical protein
MRLYGLQSPFFGIGVCLSLLFFLFALGLQQAPAAAERQLEEVTGRMVPYCSNEFIVVSPGQEYSLYAVEGDIQRPKLPPTKDFTLPIYPGCEGEADYEDRVFCGMKRLRQFINDNQAQPNGSAREIVIISFEVDKETGLMRDPLLRKGKDHRNVKEAQRVIQLMIDRGVRWTPATKKEELITIEFGIGFSFHGARCGE